MSVRRTQEPPQATQRDQVVHGVVHPQTTTVGEGTRRLDKIQPVTEGVSHRPLHHPVADAGNTQQAPLSRILLGDRDLSQRRRDIAAVTKLT